MKSSYRYGEKVILMLKEVERLIFRGEFIVVTDATPIAEGEELPIQPGIVGQETLLEMVWKRLEDEVGIVGLYGMGGVGKTTLLTQINNRFSERGGGFDVRMWIVVSKSATVHKIQGIIGEKLGLRGKDWDEKSETERSHAIYNVLKGKKFVLLLDDIWEKVKLDVIGVPDPRRAKGCKVAFTTRSRDVCGRMGVDDPIEVRCLDTDKAWDLFEEKVGKNTLGGHPDIPELAMKVAEKCSGPPLALIVIGETMASKRSVQEWHRAVDVLTSSATDFSGVEDQILPVLKYSYDSLDGEMTKSCFLYCSLFPEDGLIDKEGLIEYWIGEGFIDEKEGRERAFNQGYEILETLVRACLLLEDGWTESKVKMHDVVREMAMWIASDLGKHKERCIVQAGAGLREIPEVKNWNDVRRISLMENDIGIISGRPDCSELTSLILRRNCRAKISPEFFESMPKLRVLDLSLIFFSGFEMDMCNLVSLRYLNLSETYIEGLPFCLDQLKMLTHLNLEWTSSLENLNGISELSSLRTLKLLGSKVRLDMSLMEELQLLEHLEFISVSVSPSALVEEKWFYDLRMGRCIQKVCIEERQGESVKVLVLPAFDGLRNIFIRDCGMLEEIEIEKAPWNKSLTSPRLSNLTEVRVIYCNGLKDLTWLLFTPHLVHLHVAASEQVEDSFQEPRSACLDWFA